MSAEKLQKLAGSKFDIKAAKLALLERVDAQISFTWGGGLFKATPYLLAEIAGYFAVYSEEQEIIILDEYLNPIKVTLGRFRNSAIEARRYALNTYETEFDKLKKVRKGDKL
jgi:hypothetical protein